MIRYFTILFLFYALTTEAQSVSGKITDDKNKPLPYASVYIKEVRSGTMSNEDGKFDVKLQSGNYTFIVSHIAFETQTIYVSVSKSETLNINMKSANYNLPEAVVKGDGDKAAAIMRKAIGMAPYYKDQLLSYKANVYIKGSLKVTKIAGVVKMMAGKDIKEAGIKENEKYIQETVNEIVFDKGNITHRVVSEKNTFPPEWNVPGNVELGMMGYNIYNTDNPSLISPLSPKAFSYYRFKYEGYVTDNNKTIYKIKVTPKYKNNIVMEGYVYVVDEQWNIHNLDLSQNGFGVKSRIKQNYIEPEQGVFVIAGFNLDADISIMGNKAVASYVNSVKYEEYKINPLKNKIIGNIPDISEPETGIIVTTQKTEKYSEEIQKLASKDDLRPGDALKMAKLIKKKEKEEDKQLPDSLKMNRSSDYAERYKIVSDSASKQNDNRYWDTIRAIPLLPDEVITYQRTDSVKLNLVAKDSVKKKRSVFGKISGGILTGHTFRADSSSLRIEYGGIINPSAPGFNLVDGFRFKQDLSIRKRFENKQKLDIYLLPGYAFARKNFTGTADVQYLYMPLKQGKINLGAGYTGRDFNAGSGVPAFDNAVWTLFARQNYAHFYNDAYLYANHSIEAFRGMTVGANFSYHNRTRLYNNSNYSFLFRESRVFSPNIPNNVYVAENIDFINCTKSTIAIINLSYTPGMRYRTRRGERRNAGSDFPTIDFIWKKGITGIFGSKSDFDLLQIGIRQKISFGIMQSFSYDIKGGKFPNNSKMHFSEFAHFGTRPYFGSFAGYEQGYRLQPVYSMSTNDYYVAGDISYSSLFLVLKYLPLLNRTLVTENLYLSAIHVPQTKNYFEAGYGLGNIFFMGNISVFAGFHNFKFQSSGLKISFNILDSR